MSLAHHVVLVLLGVAAFVLLRQTHDEPRGAARSNRAPFAPALVHDMTLLHAVVAGASGGTGRHVVATLARDGRFERVTALVRTPHDPATLREFYMLDDVPQSVSDRVVEVPLDTDNIGALSSAVDRPVDAFLTCLGIYTQDARDEEHFESVEIGMNLDIFKALSPTRAAYLSGWGVKRPSIEGNSWIQFARVKGKAEDALATAAGEGHFTAVRPGGIARRAIGKGKPVLGHFFINLSAITPLSVDADDIARAMVWAVTRQDDAPPVLENSEIKARAKDYVAEQKQFLGRQ